MNESQQEKHSFTSMKTLNLEVPQDLDLSFTVTISARAGSTASTSVGNSDLLSVTALAVSGTVARIAVASAADLSLGLSNGVTIAVARRALAVNSSDAIRDGGVHF